MYEFDFDPRAEVLRIVMRGAWSLDTVARFAADVFAKGAEIRKAHDGFAILTDASNCPVPSSEVVAALSDVMIRGSSINPAPNATVLSIAFTAIESRSVLIPANYRIFFDRDEAMAWIEAEWVRRRAGR
jgi:hypothetical protein